MDYYNDFQNMVRSNNIERVIDKHRLHNGKDCIDFDTKQSINEVMDVVDEMKKCRRKTLPHLIKLCRICASFTVVQMALFLHIIQGLPLISFAISEGISEQAAQQMWVRMCNKNPDLAVVRNKRRKKNEYIRTSNSSALQPPSPHNVLGQSEGRC